MGFVDSIKEKYYKWEDKWYDFLDKLDSKGIPVYAVIEPIDKILPSFALFLILIVALLIFLITAALTVTVPQTLTLSVSVLDESGDQIPEAELTAFIASTEETKEISANAKGLFEIPNLKEGDEVDLTASAEGFQDKTITAIASKDDLDKAITLSAELPEEITKTVRLVDSSGLGISGSATLSFSCSNPYALPPEDYELTPYDYGEATVTVPSNCETLNVTIYSDDYELASSEVTDEPIYLQEKEEPEQNISLNIFVQSETEQPLDGIKVTAYLNGIRRDEEITGLDGTVSFVLSPGYYTLTAYDTKGIFEEESAGIELDGTNSSETETITLKEGILGQIKIKVIDSALNQPVHGATVKLINSITEEELDSAETDLNSNTGIVSFNITRDVPYTAMIRKEGYLAKEETGLRISDDAYEVKIQPCSPSTCGLLKVKVIDQDGFPVQDATVALFVEKNNSSYLSAYETKQSDINGMAEFQAISEGTYHAYAFKETNNGESKPAFFNAMALEESVEPNYIVTLNIPNGNISINVKDKYGESIANALVSIIDGRTNELIGSVYANAEGSYSFEEKADKQIYVNVKGNVNDNEWTEYFTVARKLIGNAKTEFSIELEPKIIDKGIEVEYLGLFLGDEKSSSVSPAETYTAKFKLRVPEGKNYSETGIHLRVGENGIMEKDELVIKEINAPNTSVIKATAFDPESGMKASQYKTTNGEAKWANITLKNPAAGIYEIEAKIKIKETASINNPLKLHYRAWGKGKKTERFPADSTISNDLYAETKTVTLDVGTTSLCDEEFCFQATILDREQDISTETLEEYTAKLYAKYLLKFVLTNNSKDKVHNEANLRVKNPEESVLIESYTFTDAQTKESAETSNSFELPRLEAGDFRPNNKIIMEMDLLPNKNGSGTISLTLVSDQKIVWSKNISIKVSAEKNLVMSIEPSAFMAGIDNDLNVTVREEGQKEMAKEVAGVIVKLKNKFDETLQSKTTPLNGVVYLTLPASAPGAVYWVTAEKPEYNEAKTQLSISGDLIELTPQTLGFALNVQDKFSETKTFTIKNKTNFPLKVSSMKLTGNFEGLIDLEKTNAIFANQFDTVVEKGGAMDFSSLVQLSESAKSLNERKDLTGRIEIKMINFGKQWSYSIPATIAIGFGAELDDPNCLQLTKAEWKMATQGNPVTTDFSLKNNCTVKGSPVALNQLEAKLELSGNQLGDYTLTLGNGTGEGSSALDLRAGYYRIVLGRMDAEQSLDFMLTFSPYGGVNGEAKTNILFHAFNPTEEEKPQIPEAKLATEINVINLSDCISTDKELVKVNMEEMSDFTINTKKCGGATEIELISKLGLSQKKFSIEDNSSQKIEVYGEKNFEGMYGIQLYVKAPNQMQPNLQKNIHVLVLDPNPNKCFSMTKYEFEILDNPEYEYDGFDSSTIINKCIDKDVKIKVDMKDFKTALADGSNVFLMSMAVGMLAQLGNGTLLNWDKDTTLGSLINKIKNAFKEHGKEATDAEAQKVADLGTDATETQIGKQVDQIAPQAADKPGLIKKLLNLLKGKPLTQAEINKINSESKCQTNSNENLKGTCVKANECTKENRIWEGIIKDRMECAEGYFCCKKATAKTPAETPPEQPATATEEETTKNKCEIAGGKCQEPLNVQMFSRCGLNKEEAKQELQDCQSDQICCMEKTATDSTEPEEAAVEGDAATGETPPNAGNFETTLVSLTTSTLIVTITPQNIQNEVLNNYKTLVVTFIDGTTKKESLIYENSLDGTATVQTKYLALNDVETKIYPIEIKICPTSECKTSFTTLLKNLTPTNTTASNAPSPSLPSTAFMNVYAAPPTSSQQPSSQQQGVGNLMGSLGGLMGGIGNLMQMFTGGPTKVLSGEGWGSTLSGSLMNGIGYAMYSYFEQEGDKEFSMIMPDVTVNWEKGIVLFDVSKEKATQRIGAEESSVSSDITFEVEAESTKEPRADKPGLKQEHRQIDFINEESITTEVFDPEFKLLKVSGTQHLYKDSESGYVYKADDFKKLNDRKLFDFSFDKIRIDTTDANLKEKDSEKMTSKFHLLFEAVPFEEKFQEPKGLLECQSGTRTGSTGANALPKIEYNWSWNGITETKCDAENAEGIYCDATQFSIEVLKKVIAVSKELESVGQELQCPNESGGNYAESELADNDIGVKSVRATAKSNDTALIEGVIENNNRVPVTTKYWFKVINLSTEEEIECGDGVQEIEVMTSENVSCEFSGLDEGLYQAVLTIDPSEGIEATGNTPENQNELKASDSTQSNELRAGFSMGSSGVTDCEPYSTSRLSDFYAASMKSSAKDQETLKRVHFNAQLMLDRYTKDFQHDFDNYARNQALFGAEESYRNEKTGLWKYFSNTDLFKFTSRSGEENPEGILVSPGIYDVIIDITYNDKSWKLFDAQGNPTAKISIKMEKTRNAVPNSPFYYIPIDGPIGSDGRVGYGTGFSGNPIILSNSGNGENIYSIQPAGSVPVTGTELQVTLSDDFKRMNSIDRGAVLTVSKSGANNKLVFAPSNATPVALKITNNNAGEAWAFYSVGIDGAPVDTGSNLTSWNGIGYNCKSFNDKAVIEEFFETKDLKGLTSNRKCAVIDGDRAPYSYGLEFCDPVRYGDMYLKTVFYSPQNKTNLLNIVTANDSAIFKTLGGESETVILNQAMGTKQIEAVSDVFDLVKEGYVCVSGTDAVASFWWNPKKLLDSEAMQSIEAEAINSCIK